MKKIIFKQNNKSGFVRGIDINSKNEKVRAFGKKAINYFKSGKYIDYITRAQACYNFIGEIPKFETNQEAIFWFNKHTKEWNKLNEIKETNSGLYSLDSNDLKFKNIDLKFGKKMLAELNDKQYIWDTQLSFGQLGIEKRLFDINEISELLEENLNSFFIRNNLNIKNLNVIYAMHANTKNPHIHLAFWEREPQFKNKYSNELVYKQKGLIPLSEYMLFSSILTNKINEKERYKKILWNRGEIRSLKMNLRTSFKNPEIKIDKTDKLVNDILQSKSANVWNYGRLDATTKQKLDNLVMEIIKNDKSLSNEYSKFNNHSLFLEQTFNKQTETKQVSNLIQKEQRELKVNLANIVLSRIKNLVEAKTQKVLYLPNIPNINFFKRTQEQNFYNYNSKWEIAKQKFEDAKREFSRKIEGLKIYYKYLHMDLDQEMEK
ncbi:relaxase MobL [Mycoplasma sp. 125]|uniref:relaxase MobL n=1 Tax=Mycoplasma sp. 125 TaxID=3447505 RepID=UPI003F660439